MWLTWFILGIFAYSTIISGMKAGGWVPKSETKEVNGAACAFNLFMVVAICLWMV